MGKDWTPVLQCHCYRYGQQCDGEHAPPPIWLPYLLNYSIDGRVTQVMVGNSSSKRLSLFFPDSILQCPDILFSDTALGCRTSRVGFVKRSLLFSTAFQKANWVQDALRTGHLCSVKHDWMKNIACSCSPSHPVNFLKAIC